MNQLIVHPDYNLQEGFSMAYFAFLKAIQENRAGDMGTFCERNLYRAVYDGI